MHSSRYPKLLTEEGYLQNKGNSKRHRTDEKSTIFLSHVPPLIFGLFLIAHHKDHPFKNAVVHICFNYQY